MIQIVEYQEKYVEEIAKIVIRNLMEINSKDYGMEKAKEMSSEFEVSKLKETLKSRTQVFVALENDIVVGTAGIDKGWYSDEEYWILTVFVSPESQGKGTGRKLIQKVEEFATTLPCKKLVIPASITACEFYHKLGYEYKNNKKELNENKMYIMEKEV